MKCIKTTQSPSLPSPVCFISLLPRLKITDDTRFLAYGTENEIGIQMLPLDGNPYKSLSFVGSASKLIQFVVDCHGEYLFTASENDSSFFQWKINRRAVRVSAYYGGTGLNPYYCMLEGGYNGRIFKELTDFFYYFQIVHDGEYVYDRREVTDKIHLCDIPNYFTAVGYFPSLAEVRDIIQEVKGQSKRSLEEIEVTFEEAVKLYLNYRPARGIFNRDLENAFNEFIHNNNSNTSIEKADISSYRFTQGLLQYGESFTNAELDIVISTLLGTQRKTYGIPGTELYSLEDLKETITYDYFVHNLLGIKNKEETPASELKDKINNKN